MTTSPPVAIVTGGARRVGRAIVEDLAAHGWAVAIHYNHSGNEAEKLAAELTRSFAEIDRRGRRIERPRRGSEHRSARN